MPAAPPDSCSPADTRESTTALAQWIGSGIQAGGGTVTWGGILPTPAVSLLLRDGRWDAGIVISASHNPAADNGIKVLSSGGEKISAAPRKTTRGSADRYVVDGPPLPRREEGLAAHYRRGLLASLATPKPLNGMSIVLDAANGAGIRPRRGRTP